MSFFNKKLKKKKNGLKEVGSGTTLMENTKKKKTKTQNKDLNKRITAISRNCKTLYQITNLSRGNEEELLDDFLFQEFHNKVLEDRSTLQNLLEKSKLSKKMNKEVEQTLDQISDVLKSTDKSLEIANSKTKSNKGKEKEKEKEKKKEKEKIEQLLEINTTPTRERKRRATVNDSPRGKQKPQLDLFVPLLARKDSSEKFDDFFTRRQRRYSGSRFYKD
ncbi:e3 ubiquitin-protein ligase traip [Anaeramoeba flamelloides]|uniref:E3 ubiquitin-protein ligase traip n=1 Tax=Anaeramoeba flamelloides TaxID=1746091 RepID=A0ABQ8XZ10_9EUKA|nr:e3 ubiquitin-protein ligase traip [Anaeramoeba flamelloides]